MTTPQPTEAPAPKEVLKSPGVTANNIDPTPPVKMVPIALTYNGWLQNILNILLHISQVQGRPASVLNLGSGNRPSVESITNAEGSVKFMDIVNADYITFKRDPQTFNTATDILSYLESCPDETFTSIISCRYFEHIPWGQLDYYLYQMYRVLVPNSSLVFVVPDFAKLGKALLELETKFDYQKWITLNSEYFNEKNDPHSCLWSSKIAEKLITGEGFFSDVTINPITIDGRHWYIEINAKKKPECLFKK